MSDATVRHRGNDSSGRGIYATDFMWNWWQKNILADKKVKPFADKVTITQGAWMVKNGGGAAASAGYHDGGGTFDLRVWNLTDEEVRKLIIALRYHGAAAWLRNVQHGGFSDPHIHLVLGSDSGLSAGARSQWADYLNGGDGMRGRDYHWRPNPIRTTPPVIEKPKPNNVQKGRKAIRKALRWFRKAEDRTVVQRQADKIEHAYSKLPKK